MEAPTSYRERPLLMVLVDLARFTHAVAGLSLREMVELLDGFYRAAGEVVEGHRGRVVKFVGDGCFAVFEPDDVLSALHAVDLLRGRVEALGIDAGVTLELGANVHLSTVAEARLGVDGAYEVVGMGTVHTFRMGGGAGTRISEPVYRKLPSGQRGPWRKHQPPAAYVWQG